MANGWDTEAQRAYDAIEGLTDQTCDGIYRALLRAYSPMAVAVAAAAGAVAGGAAPGGAGTLADLTDVSGTPGPGKSPLGDETGSAFTLTPVVSQADLDALLAAVAAVNWRPLELEPGFDVYSDPQFATPKYRLTLNNVVHVEGMVGCSPPLGEDDAGKTVATLAGDSCPDATLLYGCPAFGNAARFDVNPDGEITFQGMLMGGGQIDWFSLSPITFSVGA